LIMSNWGTPNPELEERYAAGWHELSRDTKRSQQVGEQVRCSCCGNLHEWDNIETHHAYYLGEGDTPGLNIFPVCGDTSDVGMCHHWLHLKEQWYRDPTDPTWKSGNYPDVVLRLRHGFVGQPHILPFDWDWGVVGRVSAVIAGLAVVTLAVGGPKPGSVTVQSKISATGYSAANVRVTPGGAISGAALPNGTAVAQTEQQGDWCRITHTTGTGWVWCKFVAPN
jgi:hypothetical protein